MLGAVPQTLGTANDSEIFRIYGLDLLGPLPGMSQIWHGSNGSGLTAYLSRTPCHKDFNKMSGWTRNKFHESHKTSSKLKKLSVHITIGIGLFWGAFPYWPTLGRCHLPRIIHPRKQNLSPENGWLEDEHSGVSENSGTPKIIHFNRVFHYKLSILGYHYFWKHPFLLGWSFFWGGRWYLWGWCSSNVTTLVSHGPPDYRQTTATRTSTSFGWLDPLVTSSFFSATLHTFCKAIVVTSWWLKTHST